MNLKPEIEAEIFYFTYDSQKNIGRHKPVFSGYKGQFYYDGKNWDAPQTFIDKQICYPGEKVKVHLNCYSPEAHMGKLYIGKEFQVREGAKIVGKGKITALPRKDYECWEVEEKIEKLNSNGIPNFTQKELKKVASKFCSFFKKSKILEDFKIQAKGGKNCFLKISCHQNLENNSLSILNEIFYGSWNHLLLSENEIHKSSFESDKIVISFITWKEKYYYGEITITR